MAPKVRELLPRHFSFVVVCGTLYVVIVILDGLSQLQLSWVCERISILMSASSKHLSSFHPASRTGLFSLLAEFGEYAEDEVAQPLCVLAPVPLLLAYADLHIPLLFLYP